MDFFGEIFDRFGEALTSVLPQSPFSEFLADFADIPYLGYLNYFVPVRGILIVMGVWLAAISFPFWADIVFLRGFGFFHPVPGTSDTGFFLCPP